jgi:MFS family permease
VPRVVTEATVDRAGLDVVLQPRAGLVAERALGQGRFELVEGPLRHYRRVVAVEALAGGRAHVVQTVDYRLAVPYFAFVFALPVRRRLSAIGPEPDRPPWWASPQRLDERAANALGTLAAVAVVFGYLNTLFTQTIAFAADEFHVGNGAQGVAGAVVRGGGLLALLLTAAADRRGRRLVLLASTALGCLLAAGGAVAPSLVWLTGSQVLARAFAYAMLILVGIVAAEEMPAGCRAYAVSLLAMAAALGSGACTIALRLADIGPRGWRLVYLLPLLGLLVVRGIARRLPESRRYRVSTVRRRAATTMAGHGRRLALLAASGALLNLFIAPDSQFTNRFLHDELGFSGGRIALLTVGVGTPGALGVILGGRLADVRGRRVVAAVALSLGTALEVALFFSRGWPVWIWALSSNVIGAASVPALGVYGPELFPTALRGTANGLINVAGLVGSAVGLAGVGLLADHFDRVGPAMAMASIGPFLLAALVLAAYPETAHRELEELNPEDAAPP